MPEREATLKSRSAVRPQVPNIVCILADDLGSADLGCYGSRAIRTPNLDRLAGEGVRFTHGYSSSPWCSATRIALYTGRHPCRLPGGLEEPLVTHSAENGIPDGHPTLPSLLAAAGYDTAMFGKWHCGWLPWYSPLRIGFGTFFGNLDGAVDYFEHISMTGKPDLYEGETPVEVAGYYTDLISQRAADQIARHHDGPFYVQVNYTAPHWPWEGRGDEVVGARLKRQCDGTHPGVLLHLDGGSLAKYGEMVEVMDEGIGQILEALETARIADNTLVLFTSDNGGERWSDNWPHIGQKGDLTEGGIRVPCILRWPAALDAHQVSDHPVVTVDWTATFLDAAAVSPQPTYPLDGVSLVPWLAEGAPYPVHDLFFRIASQGALRRGRFKYLRDLRDRAIHGNWPKRPGPYELLYDVTVDGREAANLAAHHPDVVTDLRDAWDRFNDTLLPYPSGHRGLPARDPGNELERSYAD